MEPSYAKTTVEAGVQIREATETATVWSCKAVHARLPEPRRVNIGGIELAPRTGVAGWVRE
jgi:hypothetical protein